MFWTLVRLLPSYSWRKYAIPARATVADFGTFRVRGTGTRYGLTVLTTLGAELRGEPQERYHSTNTGSTGYPRATRRTPRALGVAPPPFEVRHAQCHIGAGLG